MNLPFTRKGQPVRVPFSDTSAATEFPMPDLSAMPMGMRKTFMFINASPYDVRLEGTAPTDPAFVQVTEKTGYLIPARSFMGPFTSKNPVKLSAQAFSTPGNPISPGSSFDGCVLELLYGEGD